MTAAVAVAAPASPILLDTGPSKKGAHRLQAILTCPALYGFTKRFDPARGLRSHPAADENRGPLVRGSIGHVALAHHYARRGCEQNGLPLDTYFPPHEAIDLVANKFGPLGDKFRSLIHRAYDGYAAFYAMEPRRVHAVEYVREVQVPDPNHPGVFNEFTQRWDLVEKDDSGRYWITDHKFVSDLGEKTLVRYTLSIQFLSMAWLGWKVFGSAFGGVYLNLVGVGSEDKIGFRRKPLAPAPDAVRRFPATVAYAEALAKSWEGISAWDLPRVYSEQVCMTPYGPCSCFDLCRFGQGHVTMDGQTF
jgi:hypothetical protein